MNSLVEEMKVPLFQKYSPSRKATRVQVDNNPRIFTRSLKFTPMTAPASFIGLPRRLFNLEFSIAMARISTKVDQVVDVFYIQDLSGAKVEDGVVIKKIIEELKKDLEKIPLAK